MLEEQAEVSCPYCGETITILLDLSVEEQSYIEGNILRLRFEW